MPVYFPVDSLSEMWRGVKEPKLRAIMATVRNLAVAWFTTLGLVVVCLLWSPLPLFRLWSVQAKDTCMAELQSRQQSPRHRGELQMGQEEWQQRAARKPEVSKSSFFKSLSVSCPLLFKLCSVKQNKDALCSYIAFHLAEQVNPPKAWKDQRLLSSLRDPQFISLLVFPSPLARLWCRARGILLTEFRLHDDNWELGRVQRDERERDGDAIQALRSPWSDCGKRNWAIVCEREGRGGWRRRGQGQRIDKEAEEGGNKRGESLSGPGSVHHHTSAISSLPRLVTSSPLLALLLLLLAPACWC